MSSLRALVTACLMLLACTSDRGAMPPVPRLDVAATGAPRASDGAPSPTPSATSRASSSARAHPPPTARSPFDVLLSHATPLTLHKTSDGTVVVAAEAPLQVCAPDTPCTHAGELAEVDSAFGIDEAGWRVAAIGGHHSHALWMSRTARVGEGSHHDVLRWRGGKWVPARVSRGGFYGWYSAIATWGKRVVGLGHFEIDGVSPHFETAVESPRPSDRLELLDDPRGAGPAIPGGVQPLAVASTDDGELWLLGERILDAEALPVVVRYARGATRGHVSALPLGPACEDGRSASVGVTAFAVRAADRVAVGGKLSCRSGSRVYLVRFDGTRWTNMDVPFANDALALSLAADGALWMAGASLLRQAPGGSFERVPVRGGCRAAEVMVRSAGETLVVASCEAGDHVLLQAPASR